MMDAKERTVPDLGLDHKDCCCSSGIDDSITAGQGDLDWSGWFAIPCPECAERFRVMIYGGS